MVEESFYIMLDLPKAFKEITPETTQTDKWREFCFNSGK